MTYATGFDVGMNSNPQKEWSERKGAHLFFGHHLCRRTSTFLPNTRVSFFQMQSEAVQML
jgi:hypothetical protein